jgi:hypothetical protein
MEPIFHNPAIHLRSVQSANLQRQLMAAGLQRLCDLQLLREEGGKPQKFWHIKQE